MCKINYDSASLNAIARIINNCTRIIYFLLLYLCGLIIVYHCCQWSNIYNIVPTAFNSEFESYYCRLILFHIHVRSFVHVGN